MSLVYQNIFVSIYMYIIKITSFFTSRFCKCSLDNFKVNIPTMQNKKKVLFISQNQETPPTSQPMTYRINQ